MDRLCQARINVNINCWRSWCVCAEIEELIHHLIPISRIWMAQEITKINRCDMHDALSWWVADNPTAPTV